VAWKLACEKYQEEKRLGGRRNATPPKLWKLILRVFWKNVAIASLFKCFWLIIILVTNLVFLVGLLDLLSDLENQKIVTWGNLEVPYEGFIYVCLFCLGEIIRSFSIHNFWQFTIWLGFDCRSSLIAMMYEKLLKLRGNTSEVGLILNVVQNDVERIRDACIYGIFLVSTPISLLAIVLCGYSIIGPSIFIGFLVLLLSVPVQAVLAKKIGKLRRKAIKVTDERVSLMNEILKAIQLIKLYAWEGSFADKVQSIRQREVKQLRHTAYLKSLNAAFSQVLPLVTCAVTFGFYTLVFDETLEAGPAFAVLSLFAIARFPLSVLPLAVRFASESLVAFGRIEKFLLIEEFSEAETPARLPLEKGKPTLLLHDCHLKRQGCDETALVIDDLRCEIGTLTCVTGRVGSGKTSLLVGGVLGNMRKSKGVAEVRGKIAYVSQKPWVFNGTVRENICLVSAYDPEKFNKVVVECALVEDLNTFPAGADTELGERGINISGGQKTRIALARALYADADLYVLDDVLSAFDSNVSEHVWNHCIRGSLFHKTVILATHTLKFLPEADNVVVMENCGILAQGSFAELMSSSFASHVRSSVYGEKKDNQKVLASFISTAPSTQVKNIIAKPTLVKSSSSPSTGKLVVKEEQEEGSVNLETFRMYFNGAGGWPVALLVFLLFWLSSGTISVSEVWLAFWTDGWNNKSDEFFFTIYCIFAVLGLVLFSIRGSIFARMALKSAVKIHGMSFEAVMKASMFFIYVTPLGRIINRFSSDIDKVDVLLVDVAELTTTLLVRCILSIIIIAAIVPWFLVLVVPLGLFYYKMLGYCRIMLRQTKRIESITRSPMIGQIQSTIHGTTTIRAFGIANKYKDDNKERIDLTTRSQIAFYFMNRWIGFRLDLITNSIITASAFLCVTFASRLTPGLAGLVLVSAIQTTGIFQFGTRQAAELEALFTSVERLRHFISSTPSEKQCTGNTQEQQTPMIGRNCQGAIEFQGYSARYRDELPFVLSNVSFKIEGGSKTALVGRTGSGKSSTLLCLFRIIEAASGKILIDGQDIASIPLTELRSGILSMVPQSAILFSGSIRYNLDPFNQYSDDEIWNALGRVHMRGESQVNSNSDVSKFFVKVGNSSSAGLDFVISEGGQNVSKGQRQLLGFARALLKDSRIITIDEGTSSVDEVSDKLIQETLKEAFPNRTMLIIAHRLNTVRDVDKVLVLGAGSLIEEGSPDELLAREDGVFAEMWKAQALQDDYST